MKAEEKDNVIYSFSPQNKPVAELSPGEVLVVETAGSIKARENGKAVPGDIDFAGIAPATGPFFVQGAEPGDALEIEFLEIGLAQTGTALAPGVGETAYSVSGSSLYFTEEVSVPVKPFIGVAGVLPEKGGLETRLAGVHGGRLLAREASPGGKLLLPVFHRGGLFALGDVRLLKGEGTDGDSGVGCAASVKFRVDIKKGLKPALPCILRDNGTYFYASASTLEKALATVWEEGLRHILKNSGLTKPDALVVAGAVGQFGLCQAISPPYTVKFFVPNLFKALPGE